ncbi:unnamed protein product [Amoebophrya sp. A120]|nr:unnamed protein product [Amoebophrya sp. A120]|eukprot:GSA120T00024323001.1
MLSAARVRPCFFTASVKHQLRCGAGAAAGSAPVGERSRSDLYQTTRRFFASSSSSKYYDNSKAQRDYERSQTFMEKLKEKNEAPVETGKNDSRLQAETTSTPPAAAGEPAAAAATSSKITSATVRDQQKVLFPRLTEEASEEEFGEADEKSGSMKKEVGFKYLGKEPTSYGDWSHKGRVTDF